MIDSDGIKARGRRLEELAKGLSCEVGIVREGNDPLLFRERRAYLKGIQDAIAGLESARVALAQVGQRLDREAQRRAG